MKRILAFAIAFSLIFLLTAFAPYTNDLNSRASSSGQENAQDTNEMDSETKELLDSINEETAEDFGSCGENLRWYYKDGVFVVKGTGKMDNYENHLLGDPSPWFYDYNFSKKIKTVIVDEGCTSIGDYAFGCESVTQVYIPNTVTSIGESAFMGCTNLESMTIPPSVKIIKNTAFGGCDSLTSITVPSSVELIEQFAFWECENLASVTLSEGVEELEDYVFSNSYTIKEITIPASVVAIKGNLAPINTITFLGDAPEDFDIDPETTKTINYHGKSFDKLKEKYPNVNWVSMAQSNKIDDWIDKSTYDNKSSSSSEANKNSSDSTTEDSSATSATDSDIVELFRPLNKEDANVSGICGSNMIWCYRDGTLVFKGTGRMTNFLMNYVEAPGLNGGMELDMPWCDYEENIEMLIVENGCTSIGRRAFENHINLSTAIMPNTIEHIGDWAFKNCVNLTSVKVPNKVKYIGQQAFSGCTKLEYVHIPNGVEVIGDGAFSDCDSLTKITIPTSVETIEGRVFSECNNLSEITLSEGLKTIGVRAFSGCNNLKTVNIPEGVTTIENSAFRYCDNLTTVTLPKTVTTIGGRAFSNCKKLEQLIIPSSVTKIVGNLKDKNTIVFEGDAPEGLETIENVDTIYYRGTGFEKIIEENPDVNWVKQ